MQSPLPLSRSAVAAAALALLTLPAAAQAPELAAPAWTVDKPQSRVGFSAIADGEAFAGKFADWDAQIGFDPANLSTSSAMVTIRMDSVETDDPARAEYLQEDAWFASALYPDATFTTSAIRAEGDGYVADGTLTIRDISRPVSLPFDLAIDGNVARMKGELVLHRKDFDLGLGSWQDSHLAADVRVEVSLTARKAG